MTANGSPTRETHQVLVNDAGQYSLFPSALPIPGGWRAAGFTGTEDDCAAYVDQVWAGPAGDRPSDA